MLLHKRWLHFQSFIIKLFSKPMQYPRHTLCMHYMPMSCDLFTVKSEFCSTWNPVDGTEPLVMT